MTISLYWLQCGGCGGDTMSILNAEDPNILEALDALGIDVLWHPTSSNLSPETHRTLLQDLISGKENLGILCVEGAVIEGPDGTGMFNSFEGKPKKDLVAKLAAQADIVIAAGTCACYGGVTAAGESEASGLQFSGEIKGGFLGRNFKSKTGLPVINIPGCPLHPISFIGTISMLLGDHKVELNTYQAPVEYYSMLVHQGCTRNEYHEYQVEETDFGQKGCLFFHMGCHGPLAHGPCNKFLWNNRSCKTRSGVPCFGCTEPGFPQNTPFFETPNIVGLPINLPDGVDRPHYLAYKGMAAAAAPERLRHRKTKI